MFKALTSTISQHPVISFDTSFKKIFRVNALRKHVSRHCIKCARGTDIDVCGALEDDSLGCSAGNHWDTLRQQV
jgi:hypothetical protein